MNALHSPFSSQFSRWFSLGCLHLLCWLAGRQHWLEGLRPCLRQIWLSEVRHLTLSSVLFICGLISLSNLSLVLSNLSYLFVASPLPHICYQEADISLSLLCPTPLRAQALLPYGKPRPLRSVCMILSARCVCGSSYLQRESPQHSHELLSYDDSLIIPRSAQSDYQPR